MDVLVMGNFILEKKTAAAIDPEPAVRGANRAG
jgi:hypothetical protein